MNWPIIPSEPWNTVESYGFDTYEQRLTDRINPGPASVFIEEWPIHPFPHLLALTWLWWVTAWKVRPMLSW